MKSLYIPFFFPFSLPFPHSFLSFTFLLFSFLFPLFTSTCALHFSVGTLFFHSILKKQQNAGLKARYTSLKIGVFNSRYIPVALSICHEFWWSPCEVFLQNDQPTWLNNDGTDQQRHNQNNTKMYGDQYGVGLKGFRRKCHVKNHCTGPCCICTMQAWPCCIQPTTLLSRPLSFVPKKSSVSHFLTLRTSLPMLGPVITYM